MIKGILFDLDGVIVETAELHYLAWKAMANSLGFDIDEEFNEQLKGVDRKESLNRILKYGNIELSEDEKMFLMVKKNNMYIEKLKDLTKDALLPGIEVLLYNLKEKGYKIALASASKNGPFILEKLEIDKYFDVIVDPSTVKGKPSPEIFQKAGELLGLNNKECIGVEDSIAGINAINSADMISIGIGDNDEIKRLAKYSLKDTSELTVGFIENIK